METIEQLKKIDLCEYPIGQIDDLLSKIGGLCVMITNFHDTTDTEYPKKIERAVNNSNKEPEFNSVSRISFKPLEYNTNYLRASTPNNTMFYGSVISEIDLNFEETKNSRIVGAMEVSSLIRSSEIIEGWSRMTFGKWEVIEKISLVTIIDPTKTYEKPYLNEMRDKYLIFLEQEPEYIREKTKKWLIFLSEEFSKYVDNGNNHKYLISSKFTELLLTNLKYDGVIYPSVQSDGYGLCVAIHPRAMKKLKLTEVLQCKLLKKLNEDGEGSILLENEKYCIVKNDADKFELQQIKK
jgi:hypothetical protein